MKAGKKLINRLRSRAGESIAEVLVAVLISALGLAILAGMVAASSNMVTKSKSAMQTYIQEENKLAAQSGTGSTGSISMKVGESAKAVRLPDSSASEGEGYPVAVNYFSTEANNKTLVSYSLKES